MSPHSSWKKLNTVGELKKTLNKFPDDTKIFMYSDGEGNSVNKFLCYEYFTEGLFFVPWEQYDITLTE